jgi:hypothetical protein
MSSPSSQWQSGPCDGRGKNALDRHAQVHDLDPAHGASASRTSPSFLHPMVAVMCACTTQPCTALCRHRAPTEYPPTRARHPWHSCPQWRPPLRPRSASAIRYRRAHRRRPRRRPGSTARPWPRFPMTDPGCSPSEGIQDLGKDSCVAGHLFRRQGPAIHAPWRPGAEGDEPPRSHRRHSALPRTRCAHRASRGEPASSADRVQSQEGFARRVGGGAEGEANDSHVADAAMISAGVFHQHQTGQTQLFDHRAVHGPHLGRCEQERHGVRDPTRDVLRAHLRRWPCACRAPRAPCRP